MEILPLDQDHFETPRFSDISELERQTADTQANSTPTTEISSLKTSDGCENWQFSIRMQHLKKKTHKTIIVVFEHVLYALELVWNVLDSYNASDYVTMICTGDFDQLSLSTDSGLKFFRRILDYRPQKCLLLTTFKIPNFGLDSNDIIGLEPFLGDHSDLELFNIIPTLKARVEVAEGKGITTFSQNVKKIDWLKRSTAESKTEPVDDDIIEEMNPLSELIKYHCNLSKTKTKLTLDKREIQTERK